MYGVEKTLRTRLVFVAREEFYSYSTLKHKLWYNIYMPTRPFPYTLLVLILLIAVVNAFAQYHSWYWTMRWFDMPMHFADTLLLP